MIENLWVFVATTFLMLAVPGPDFVLVTRNAVAGDRSQACRTVAGICVGLAVLTLVTAGGLAAVIATNAAILVTLRLVGGGYLLLLGGVLMVSAWRGRRESGASSPGLTRSPVAQGFLNNVLNPKALIFYLTFMPQFLVPGPPVFLQTLGMGIVVVVCAAVWWTLYVAMIGRLSTALARRSVRTTIDVGAGATLGGLGAVTVFSGP